PRGTLMLPYSTPDPDDDQDDMRRPTSDALARQLRDAYFASEEAGRGSPFDSSVPPVLIPTDTGGGLGPQVPYRRPHRRKVLLPLLLFLATCASTFFVGALHLGTNIRGVTTIQEKVIANWDSGLQYMAAVMAILLFHEMGHFLQAVRYHIPASFPFFIPFPASPIGTMGAALVL